MIMTITLSFMLNAITSFPLNLRFEIDYFLRRMSFSNGNSSEAWLKIHIHT